MSERRAGFTLVEVMTALLIGAVVLIGIYRAMIGQQRAYRQHDAVSTTQQVSRISVEMLASELREASASGGDVFAAGPDSVGIRALRKVAVVCTVNKLGKSLDVAEVGTEAFTDEDSVLVYADRDTMSASDDTWYPSKVESTVALTSCSGPLSGVLGTLLPGSTLRRLTLPSALGARIDSVYPGAVVRSFQRAVYGMRTVSGEAVLARQVGGTVVPLIGPLATNGVQFTYYDSLGTVLTPVTAADRLDIARIQIKVVSAAHGASLSKLYEDSLVTNVYLRGN